MKGTEYTCLSDLDTNGSVLDIVGMEMTLQIWFLCNSATYFDSRNSIHECCSGFSRNVGFS